MRLSLVQRSGIAIVCALSCALPLFAQAQTQAQDQLRATIKAEIMADPRSQSLSQAQIQSMVDTLASQAQKQGVTASQLTYRPAAPTTPSTENTQQQPTAQSCSDFMCAFSHAFGLDGSAPLIVGGLFITAILFIFLFSKLREMGHPHMQLSGDMPTPPAPSA
ncbi:MAG TPA: hypothetical protein VMU25_03885 [Candidatus Paceibacterota bacterium]|nr:hypothetical protein [Candidatus Paceibacterota bacterium]